MTLRSAAAIAYLYPSETGPKGAFERALMRTFATDLALPPHRLENRCISFPSGPSLDISRNTCMEITFLDGQNVDWLMFLDSDMVWEPLDLLSFLGRAEQEPWAVYSGLYAGRNADGSTFPVVYGPDLNPMQSWYPTYTRVASAGAGALLVSRPVAEAMHSHYGPEWFSTLGRGMNEDHAFAARLGALGIPLWLDARFGLRHLKMVEILPPQSEGGLLEMEPNTARGSNHA